ncbi:putative immunity/bacteriocin fusion bifunctional protein [Paenibacillus sp. NPDC093718]|uniref:putative immunity/bacteriocin fusion bifunctional protein n=1 Tax=Paenibacillus sp. NPDC093718 TaxID=3390601 RepID=UPI003CFE1292
MSRSLRKMNFFVLITFIAFVIFSVFTPVKANAYENSSQSCGCSNNKEGITPDEARAILEADGVEIIDNVSKDDKESVNSIIDTHLSNYQQSLNDYSFSNYEQIPSSDVYIKFQNVEMNGVLYSEVVSKYTVFKDSSNNLITQSSWIDLEKNNVVELGMALIDNNQEVFEILVIDNHPKATAEEGIIVPFEKDWSLFGQKFACSMTGLVACGVYCTVWGLVNPVAGVTCDIVCGAAFAVACF